MRFSSNVQSSTPQFLPDFMSDALWDGRRYRTFDVLTDFNREALLIAIDFNLPAPRVVRELEWVAAVRGYPLKLTLDNERAC